MGGDRVVEEHLLLLPADLSQVMDQQDPDEDDADEIGFDIIQNVGRGQGLTSPGRTRVSDTNPR